MVGYKISESEYDYFAIGILGQIIYVSPRRNTIAVIGKRLGSKELVAYNNKRVNRPNLRINKPL